MTIAHEVMDSKAWHQKKNNCTFWNLGASPWRTKGILKKKLWSDDFLVSKFVWSIFLPVRKENWIVIQNCGSEKNRISDVWTPKNYNFFMKICKGLSISRMWATFIPWHSFDTSISSKFSIKFRYFDVEC